MGKIQLHRGGLTVSASNAELESLSKRFNQRHVLVLEQFLEPSLLAQVQAAMAQGEFVPTRHGTIGKELCMETASLARHMLLLLANSAALFHVVESITGCSPVGYFDGRIYRVAATAEFSDRWHNDLVAGRLVGMSVNLGTEPFDGGRFELREGKNVICRVANTGPGSAILFRLREDLHHQVTAVQGTVPKTAFAGWFIDATCRESLLDLVRELRSEA